MRLVTRSELISVGIDHKLLTDIEKIEYETLFYQHIIRAFRSVDTDVVHIQKINKKLSNLYNKLDKLLFKIRDKTYFEHRLKRVILQHDTNDLIFYRLNQTDKFNCF